jgi:hypothetical protein
MLSPFNITVPTTCSLLQINRSVQTAIQLHVFGQERIEDGNRGITKRYGDRKHILLQLNAIVSKFGRLIAPDSCGDRLRVWIESPG